LDFDIISFNGTPTALYPVTTAGSAGQQALPSMLRLMFRDTNTIATLMHPIAYVVR
jgi:hypothetical protein